MRKEQDLKRISTLYECVRCGCGMTGEHSHEDEDEQTPHDPFADAEEDQEEKPSMEDLAKGANDTQMKHRLLSAKRRKENDPRERARKRMALARQAANTPSEEDIFFTSTRPEDEDAEGSPEDFRADPKANPTATDPLEIAEMHISGFKQNLHKMSGDEIYNTYANIMHTLADIDDAMIIPDLVDAIEPIISKLAYNRANADDWTALRHAPIRYREPKEDEEY